MKRTRRPPPSPSLPLLLPPPLPPAAQLPLLMPCTGMGTLHCSAVCFLYLLLATHTGLTQYLLARGGGAPAAAASPPV